MPTSKKPNRLAATRTAPLTRRPPGVEAPAVTPAAATPPEAAPKGAPAKASTAATRAPTAPVDTAPPGPPAEPASAAASAAGPSARAVMEQYSVRVPADLLAAWRDRVEGLGLVQSDAVAAAMRAFLDRDDDELLRLGMAERVARRRSPRS